jgi:electron-transferring-flavoprotein dehydrogenase
MKQSLQSIAVARIKGGHNAIRSAVIAAEHAATALAAARAHDELISYEVGSRGSVIGRDLRRLRRDGNDWRRLVSAIDVLVRTHAGA